MWRMIGSDPPGVVAEAVLACDGMNAMYGEPAAQLKISSKYILGSRSHLCFVPVRLVLPLNGLFISLAV
jgi:hypothetical protein